MENNFYGCVYKTTNLITGKMYIGQTTYPENVINGNYLGSGNLIKKSVNKHGFENFKVELIEYAGNQDELNLLEQKYIKEYNSLYPCGYNLQEGGNNGKHHEITKIKISENHANFNGVANPFFGKKHSRATIQNISINLKNKFKDENFKLRNLKINLGRKMSDETKRKISNTVTGENNQFFGKKHSENTIQKIREANLGRKMSDETKRKISESRKGKIYKFKINL